MFRLAPISLDPPFGVIRACCCEEARLACYDSPRLQQEALKFSAVYADGALTNTDSRQLPALDEHVRSCSRNLELSCYFGYG